jgi:hypothetical protein
MYMVSSLSWVWSPYSVTAVFSHIGVGETDCTLPIFSVRYDLPQSKVRCQIPDLQHLCRSNTDFLLLCIHHNDLLLLCIHRNDVLLLCIHHNDLLLLCRPHIDLLPLWKLRILGKEVSRHMSVFVSWNNIDFPLTYFLSVLVVNEDSSHTY